MVKEKALSRAELAASYSSKEWQKKLVDALDLVALLRDSIIGKGYRPSEDLNQAILLALTPSGKRVRDQLVKKEQVNAKDANILTFLALVHLDPLIDFNKLDFTSLTTAISSEIKVRQIQYPMIFGRELYDIAADLFKEEREYLRHEDTIRLLERQSAQGVFQSGRYLVGPFGLLLVPESRHIGPSTRVSLQHCADNSCSIVHRVQLSTSIEAGVNAGRRGLNTVLDSISAEPSDWNGFISDIIEDEENPYQLNSHSTIPFVLGDCFSDEELKILLKASIEGTNGRIVNRIRSLGMCIKDGEIEADLGRAHILQLLMTEEDHSLVSLIDGSVLAGKIIIPNNEIRTPVVNSRVATGAWRVRPQLSSYGIRSAGAGASLALQRLSATVSGLYDTESKVEMDDLGWVLRTSEGNTPQEKLAYFLRNSDPEEIIRKIVLARKENVELIRKTIGVDLISSDDDFVHRLLWKLGFPLEHPDDLRIKYWSEHDGLEALTATVKVKLDQSEEAIRARSSNYFVALERFLFDALCFSTWALLDDHFVRERPFVFYKDDARQFTLEVLNRTVEVGSPERFDLKAEPELAQIVSGFIRLSKTLISLQKESESKRRQEKDFPRWVDKTKLQEFPFRHIHPYLDLLVDSQNSLIDGLAKVGALLNDSGIMTARNGLLHAKDRVPTQDEINLSLVKAREALSYLEELGCVRATYRRTSVRTDRWGRRTIRLDSNGRSIEMISPSSFEWIKLPGLITHQYLLHGAVFALPNEMLRFVEGQSSGYRNYWSNYPLRPEKGNRIVASQSENMSAAMETGVYTATRAD